MNNEYKGALHGIPIGVKDLVYTRNMKTTMGSKIYQHFTPDYDATVVEKLHHAGAITIGKLNTHEFAYGPSGDVSYYGAVKIRTIRRGFQEVRAVVLGQLFQLDYVMERLVQIQEDLFVYLHLHVAS